MYKSHSDNKRQIDNARSHSDERPQINNSQNKDKTNRRNNSLKNFNKKFYTKALSLGTVLFLICALLAGQAAIAKTEDVNQSAAPPMLPGREVAAALSDKIPPAKISAFSSESSAAEVNSGKTEVVYSVLGADGQTGDIHVVNHFELTERGEIVDYGPYDEIVWLTGNQPVQNGDVIKITADAGNYYYEGVLKDAQLPWDFSLSWFLDGKQVDPSALSGADGELKILLTSEPGKNAGKNIIDNYTLQIGFSLPRDAATKISGEGATIAEAGNNTLVTFVFLDGGNGSCELSAQIEDFYMPAISISAVKLDIGFAMPDYFALDGDMSDLTDAISELKEGTDKLKEGAADLTRGMADIVAGVETLETEGDKLTSGIAKAADGAEKYAKGVSSYLGGVNDYVAGVKTYTNGAGDLAEGASQLEQGIAELSSGLNKLSGENEQLLQGSNQIAEALRGIRQLDGEIGEKVPVPVNPVSPEDWAVYLNSIAPVISVSDFASYLDSAQNPEADVLLTVLNGQMDGLIEAAEGSNDAADLLSGLQQLADEYDNFQLGLEQYSSGVSQLAGAVSSADPNQPGLLSGFNQIAAGLKELNSGGRELRQAGDRLISGGTELKDGGSKVSSGLSELSEGAGKYVSGLRSLSSGMRKYQEGLIAYSEGVSGLADGVEQFETKTRGLDQQMQDEINRIIDEYLNKDFVPQSFVSARNKNVAAVQFVFMTEEIPRIRTEVIEVPKEENENFWDRVRELFGG